VILALAGPPLVAWTGVRFAGRSPSMTSRLLGQAALLALLAGILGIVVIWERAPLSSLGLRPLTVSTVVWGLALAALFVFAVGPVLMRIPGWLGLAGFGAGLADLGRLPVWYLCLAIVIGGVVEEVLYRGFAIERLAGLLDSPWLAALVTLTLFGLAHVPLWGVGPALTTVLSGGILTAFYLWHRDLVANVIGHVSTDFVGIVLGPLLARLRAVRR
jgi:membrane protease YdiL (CAAX protease family)